MRWERLTDEALLDTRLCDLGLSLEKSDVWDRVLQLNEDLAHRGLRFRPHYWLSNEWFSPDGVPGIALPFYLACARLRRLEEKMMLEVEGGTKTWCMQLLRHETGHAIQTAYRLHRRTAWRKLFGRSTKPYPATYSPKPFSRKYVLHLDWWYAQSHPSEDFAETFAVWLRPGSSWRKQYKNWPAMRKLEYVDALMTEIADMPPPVKSREQTDSLATLRHTLREHYREKQQLYESDYPEFYDRDLRRIFPENGEQRRGMPASTLLRRIGPDLRNRLASWTGEHAYVIDQVMKEMICRCRELDLRVSRTLDEIRIETAILLTMQVTNFLQSGEHRLTL